jgi:hypothetical protein
MARQHSDEIRAFGTMLGFALLNPTYSADT